MLITNCDMYNEEQKIIFAFSPELDTAFLAELYGDDLQQAELIFESSGQQLRSEIALAGTKFHDGDLPGLKKVIHKMKPLFGYIGMSEVSEEFAAFEQECLAAGSPSEIESRFQNIIILTQQSLQKADKEVKRLKQYNTQYL